MLPDHERPYYLKLSHSLLTVFIILFLLYEAENILMPLAFGGLFSILLITPAGFLERRGFSRGIAALITILLSLLLVIIISYLVSSQILAFKKDIPALIEHVSDAVLDISSRLQKSFDISTESMNQFFKNLRSGTFSYSLFRSTFSTLSSTVLYFLLVILYTFLMLLYRRLFVSFLVKSFTNDTEKVYAVLTKTKFVIKSYLVGLIIEMFIVACLNCVSFFILGVKYALLLGVIAALLNLIPYLGIFIACILSMLVTFTTDSTGTVVGVGIVLLVVHLIDANFLLPKIVGSKVKMNALATIVAVIVGSALWGISGMFLAIPFIAILKVIFENVNSMQAWCILLGEDVAVESSARESYNKIARPFIKKIRKS
jgi:putative permease